MAETVKKISIRQKDSGLYDTKPIGVDAENIDGKISLDQLSDEILEYIKKNSSGAPSGMMESLVGNIGGIGYGSQILDEENQVPYITIASPRIESVYLEWEWHGNPSDVEKYQVVSYRSGGYDMKIEETTSLEYTVENLTAGLIYIFWVFAYYDGHWSPCGQIGNTPNQASGVPLERPQISSI